MSRQWQDAGPASFAGGDREGPDTPIDGIKGELGHFLGAQAEVREAHQHGVVAQPDGRRTVNGGQELMELRGGQGRRQCRAMGVSDRGDGVHQGPIAQTEQMQKAQEAAHGGRRSPAGSGRPRRRSLDDKGAQGGRR